MTRTSLRLWCLLLGVSVWGNPEKALEGMAAGLTGSLLGVAIFLGIGFARAWYLDRKEG